MKLFPLRILSVFCVAASLCAVGQARAENSGSDGSTFPGQERAANDITITDAWMKLVGPAHNVGAVFFTISNSAETPHLLSGVTSPSCKSTGGYHTDQHLTEQLKALFTHLALPATSTLVFPPGGYHLVCVDPDPSLKTGQMVSFTFHFMGGTEKTESVQVRKD
ncbi:copper chaperone PCu(A)C [Acetobacter sp. AN02]|uniref:copper chaperone PCu(A)C n=1 Tax=Acetobacter sp. AN02 TaxID=2894186 RepID=UPI002434389C|nr:copper chaperone PCu(A)C [Acetobacter sp. AN02]MDG6095538.1 copper chaperone PCu(A)C [Acetobacter sp. AN02]